MRRWIPIGLWCIAIGVGLFDLVRIGVGLANAAPITNRLATTFHTPDLTGVRCEWISATFVQGTTVWRLPCESEGSTRPSLLRLDLQQGQADIYTLPEAYADFAMLGNNDLYGAAFAPDDTNENIFFYLDRPTSGVPVEQTVAFTLFNTAAGEFTALPQPTESRLTVRGLDWMESRPELIAEDAEDMLRAPTHFAYVDGSWEAAPVTLPEGCEQCLLQVAYREDDAWRLLWLNAPQEPNTAADGPFLTLTPQDFPLERVLLSDLDGNLLPFDLPDNRPGEPRNDGLIEVFSSVFDPAVGNVYRDTQSVIQVIQYLESDQPPSGYRHYVYENGMWQLAHLPDSDSFPIEDESSIQPYFLNYGDPQSIPDTGTPTIYNAWTELDGSDMLLTTFGSDDWILTGSKEDESSGARAFHIQTNNGVNPRAADAGQGLFPELSERFVISDLEGGYFIGSLFNFAYLHVDAEANRINPPNVVEHLIRRLTTPPAGTDARNAALIVMIGLPILVLMALALRRRLNDWPWAVVPLIFLALLTLNQSAFASFLFAL
jgi:hypothetical protein